MLNINTLIKKTSEAKEEAWNLAKIAFESGDAELQSKLYATADELLIVLNKQIEIGKDITLEESLNDFDFLNDPIIEVKA